MNNFIWFETKKNYSKDVYVLVRKDDIVRVIAHCEDPEVVITSENGKYISMGLTPKGLGELLDGLGFMDREDDILCGCKEEGKIDD